MMEIRKLDREGLKRDNGLKAQRLMPWEALNAPFEGSWCVVEPGSESGAHGHHEYEIWVAVSGRAEIISEGRTMPFVAGDIVHFPPQVRHQVVNRGDDVFQMYAVWWDEELAERFTARHRAAQR
jgi:mannose-6-phosphate isomerase-like protein (cupin superfamily)